MKMRLVTSPQIAELPAQRDHLILSKHTNQWEPYRNYQV